MNYPKTFDEYMAQKNRQAAGNTPAASGGFSYPATFDEYMQQKGQNRLNTVQTAEREKCLSASGFDRMQTDMGTLFGTMDGYFQKKHRIGATGSGYKERVGAMLQNVEKEKDYFNRYAGVMGEDAQSYQKQLNAWETQLKRYQKAMNGQEDDEGSLALGSGLARFQTEANDYFTKASETEAGTAVSNKAMQWASGAKQLLKDADEIESYLKKKNTSAAQSLLQQVQQYRAQLSQMQQTGTEAQETNPLTGKPMGSAINPNLPRFADSTGESITAGSPYKLGQEQDKAQNAELSGLMAKKAEKADWQNQSVQQHEEYIRKDFEELKKFTQNGTSQGAAENIHAGIFQEIAARLNYLATSGKCTEEEYAQLLDKVESWKKEYLEEADHAYKNYPNKWTGDAQGAIRTAAGNLPDKGDAMKEFRYQNSNLTRENIRYKPVDELLDRMHFTYGEGNWGSSAAERAAITFMGQEVLPEYLANAEMTQEQYDRYLRQIKGTPNEAQLRQEREANGLKENPDGQQAALDKYREIDGKTYLDMFETGSQNAADNIMQKYPGGMEQVFTRGLGYITKATGKALNMFGENPVGNYFVEGGQRGIDYESKDWQEGKQREYEQGRYSSDLLQNGNKFEKWTAGMTKDLTQAALEMAAAGAIAGQISAGNTALAQLSQGGKYASSLANAQKGATGYMKFASQMANLMKNSSNLIISANAALNSYGEAEDSGMSAAGRAVKLLAGGLIEYGTNGLFGGNPVVDPDGAGAVAKYIYKLTDNETIRKIVSSKVFDRIGEGLEEVTSAIAGAALDYALTGESSLSAEELVNEFTVGVLLSMVMSAPEDIIDLTARAKNYVQAHVITKFDKNAQKSLESLYSAMTNYEMEYLAGDENIMRFNGWSEKEIKRARSDWETIVREFNTLADRLEGTQSISDSFQRYEAPEGFFDNDFVDADFENAILANQTSEAALLTDRALDIRILSEREMIDSLRGSDAAQDIYTARDAQQRLDILEREKTARAAERAQRAAESAAQENTPTAEQTAQETPQAAQETAQSAAETEAAPVEPVQAEEINAPTAQETEGGMSNEQSQSVNENQERNERVGAEGQTGGVVESGSRITADRGRTGEAGGNESENLRRQKLNERVERFKGTVLDTGMDKLTADGDPDVMVGIVPVRKYTQEMKQAQREAKEQGVKTTFVVGTMSIKGEDGEYHNTDAMFDAESGRIFVSVSSVYEPEVLMEHELFHAKVHAAEVDLVTALESVSENMTAEEYTEIVEQYMKAYRGAYDSDAAVYEEILADAYAGLNRFANRSFKKLIDAMRTYTAGMQSQRESSAPTAEVSSATRRTQDSDGNEKTAREGGKRASIDRYSYQGKSMTENSEIYSYDFLTHQPDMEITELPPLSAVKSDGKIDRDLVIRLGLENAKKIGRKMDNTVVAVENKYSHREIIISKPAIQHSMDGGNPARLRTNARIGAICGEVVANAIPVNALNNKNPEAIGTYAMVALLKSGDGNIAAIITVEQHTNKVERIDTIDLAHAFNGRLVKKEGSESSTRERGYANSALPAITTFKASIADVLKIVNTTHQSILSDDVLKVLGEERNPEGYYAPRVKFSTNQQLDEEYIKAVRTGDTEKAQKMVEIAAKKAGYTIHAYHGTARADRVGTEFREDRATSGPMAFFTDSKEIAGNYARDKADTSLAYDEEYADYSTQFRVKKNGKSIPVTELWNTLPMRERMRIREAGKHITFDDEAENIIYDPEADYGVGAYDAYTLNQHGGNAIAVLVSNWLEDGNLYNEESKFLDVLRLAGIENVEYKDPDARYEKVYDVFLKIKNPFDTASVDMDFLTEFENWYEQQDEAKYQRENMQADMWDKNGMTGMEWAEEHLRDDIENGTNYSWVTIPDAVTDYLKSKGYDGIKDVGGKGGGEGHTVWIPFTGTQVKSAETEVYTDDGDLIPLSQRFKPKKRDIRFSLAENENLTTIRNLNEDDLEALYGSARIPVQELLTNTEGAGDVSLIVKNEDARNNNAHLENMAAVIPSSVDWWLVEKLKMNGLNVVEYRAGNEQARQEAEAEAEKLLEPKKRFSISPEEKVQRAENKLTAAQEKLEQEKEKAQERYKRDLTGGLRKLFNIQSYDNEALGKLLEAPMAEMQQGVKLLNAEKDDLFEAMMDLGTETLPADDYYKEIRQALRGRRIFVPEGIREDFGDDWSEFRLKAFSSGIYLTDDANDQSVDVHMLELADAYPSEFTEEYIASEMLEQIVDAAEKGKDKRMPYRKAVQENEKRFGLKAEEQLEYQRQEFEKLLNRYAKNAGAEAREAQAKAEADERLESILREADGVQPTKKTEGIVEPWTISEAAAQKRGFPYLNGRQVYPLRTWVKAADMGNYGLVLDKSTKKGMLTVLFTNKETGLSSVKDMETKLLTAVEPKYQPSVQETAALLASVPPEKLEDAADAEDLAEFYNWYDAQTAEADAKQKAETRAAAEEERKGSIVRTAEEYEQKKQERLESVQKAYLDSYGTSEPDFPYGKGKPMYSRGTTLQPGEALALLQAMTGKKWALTNRANGTWKATITKDDAPQSSITPKAALEKLQASKKNFADITAAGINPEGTPKENFKGSPAIEKAGVKIDGGIAEYSQVDAMRKGAATRRSIQRQIEKTANKWDATKLELRTAKKIASGRSEYYKLPDKCRPEVVSQLSALYLNERMTGEDLIQIRKGEIRDGLLYKMIDLFPTEKEIQADPSLFKPEKLLVLNYRTALRSMINIFGEERGMEIYNYLFAPVIRNTAESYRWTNEQFDDVREFTDSKGKKSELNQTESAYVHMMLDVEGYVQQAQDSDRSDVLIGAAENVARGESVENEAIEFALNSEEAKIVEKYAQWLNGKKTEGIDKVKCENAMKEYRKKFDLFFEAISDFLVAHGMQPIGKIKGYTPHIPIAEKFNLMDKAMELLGMNEYVTRLPSEIAGRTETFRPQKRWNPFFLERTGDKTAYDIEEAFQNYVQYLGDILFHTDDIQKIRAAESYLRSGLRGSFDTTLEKALDMSRSGNVEEKVDYLQEMGRIGNDMREYSNAELAEEFDKLIAELLGEKQNNTRYSDLVVWLKNYGDILAGKQFGGDRGTEYMGGREWLNIGNKLVGAFAKANVAGNLSSVLNQSAQLAMLQATRSQQAILKATREFCTGKLGEFRKEIDFLTGKKGIDYLVQSKTDKFVSGMFAPAEFMDSMLSTIATRAAYWDAIRNGKSHEEAMQFADWYGRALMGDRTKGAKPLAFHSKGMWKRMANLFQIEPLNTVEFVTQDIPLEIRREAEKNGKKSAARMLLRTIFGYLIAAFVLNRLTDELYGGTPAPLDIAGLTANFFASGKGLSTNDYMKSLINKVVGSEIFDVPEEQEGFDTSAALADTGYNLMNEIPFASNLSGLLGVGDRSMPMPDIYGNGKDLVDAIKTDGFFSGASAEAAAKLLAQLVPGGRQLSKTGFGVKALIEGGKTKGYGEKQRLQYPLDMEDPMTYIRTALFGVNASPEAKAYYAGDNSGLTAKQTQLWNELRDEGVNGYALYGLMMRMDDAMDYSDIPDAKDDETDEEKTKRLQQKEEHRKKARAELAEQEDLTDGQKMRIYSAMVSGYNDDEIDKLMDAGMKWNDISEILDKRGELGAGKSDKDWAAEFANWLDRKKYSGKNREAINEALVPQSASFYNKMTAAGVSRNNALKVEKKARALAGENDLNQTFKAQAIMQSGLSDKEAYAALGAVYTGSTAEKFKAAQTEGIPAKEYADFWTRAKELHADKDDDGKSISGSRKEKVIALIDSLSLTAEQKDWIMGQEYENVKWWQMPWN